MISFFSELNQILQSLIMGIITFLITTLGAATIFLFKNINDNLMTKFISLSAGIMIASSIFSLVVPALDYGGELKLGPIIISVSLLMGALLLFGISKINLNSSKKINSLILSITVHNIPEGMAIGVAFGSLFFNHSHAALMGAVSLAIGIGIQNFPEGSAISFPLYNKGYSKLKAFFIGSISALPEPIAAVIGALIVVKMQCVLPILLAFAGGAMLYVIINELIPECMNNKKKELMALYVIIGFIVMMILDVSLG